MGRQNILMGGGHRDLNFRRGPVAGGGLTLAQWAGAKGATTILTLENSVPYLEGSPLATPSVGANVVFTPSSAVAGCSGKLAVTPADTSSFYYLVGGGAAGSYGTDASRSLLTVIRSNAVLGLGAYECAMASGGTYIATDGRNFALQGLATVAGMCETWVSNSIAWSMLTQAGYVAGDIAVYLTTYDDATGDLIAYIKGTGKPLVSVNTNRAAPGTPSVESPSVGGDIRAGTAVSSTSDDVHHFSCYPSVLTPADLAEIAALVGAA